jgi:hypothetical protein
MTKQILALCTLAFAGATAAAGTAFANHTGSGDAAGTPRMPPAPTFSARIDNPWFPLKPGTRYRYAGVKDGKPSRDIVTVTHRTKTIEGVPCVAVHDRLYLRGRLEERTTDWYSQDSKGNVWYFGENTAELDRHGHVTNTSGTWRAGVHGAKPGFIMPANPQPGFNYYQEFSPTDGALDQAQVVSLDGSLTVPFGRFTNVQKSLETTDVEPGVREFKYYAPGVGLIMTEEDVNAAGVALNTFTLQSVTTGTAVPTPPAVWSGLITGGIYVGGRLTRKAFPKRDPAS